MPGALRRHFRLCDVELRIHGLPFNAEIYEDEQDAPDAAYARIARHQGWEHNDDEREGALAAIRAAIAAARRDEAAAVKPCEWPDPDRYGPLSLGVLSLHNPVRQFAISCIEWPLWMVGVLSLICCNCLLLAFDDPYQVSRFPLQNIRQPRCRRRVLRGAQHLHHHHASLLARQ